MRGWAGHRARSKWLILDGERVQEELRSEKFAPLWGAREDRGALIEKNRICRQSRFCVPALVRWRQQAQMMGCPFLGLLRNWNDTSFQTKGVFAVRNSLVPKPLVIKEDSSMPYLAALMC